MTVPFSYPTTSRNRRHGPQGYSDYASYCDWLRDEFTFRCVYCLLRETWVPGGFHLDHFLPVIYHPDLAVNYDNLLYSCATCNIAKGSHIVPDPTKHLLAHAVTVRPDGRLVGKSRQAIQIISHLSLNRPQYINFRRLWIQVVQLAMATPSTLRTILGFPENLPDLSTLRPPAGNIRPEGVGTSYFQQRELGALPDTY